MSGADDIQSTYAQRVPVLKEIAVELERALELALQGFDRLDSIRSRVKTVESFVEKAQKQQSGRPKYQNPLDEIQDQIGCRVVVFFRSDLDIAKDLVLGEFHRREIDHKYPEKPSVFEYEAIHFTCFIPREIRDRLNSPIEFFELQIKTLFQHAWAQAYHDVGYKSHSVVEPNDERLMYFAAASAWGADEIFDQMRRKYQN